MPELGLPVVELLAPLPGARILDLGCGDGALTARLAAAGATVVGVDASETMVAAARARGLDVRVMDGGRLTFSAEFDAVFTNAALHWMGDLAQVCRGVCRALRPSGRFVGEFGAAGNVASVVAAIGTGLRARGIDPDALNPWVFPTAREFGALLEGAGFQVNHLETIERPTALPGDIVEWLTTFAGCFLEALDTSARRTFAAELRDMLAPRLRSPDGIWHVDYVRLRFAAAKPDRDRGRSGMARALIWCLLSLVSAASPATAETYRVAVLQGLDKVTARVTTVKAPVGETVRFGTLEITAAVCEKRPPEETPESAAFLDIVEQRAERAPVGVFRGWMFASSPGLSPMQHPVYDLWMVDCVNSSPSAESRASPGGSP